MSTGSAPLDPRQRMRSRLILLLVLGLFFVPLAASFVLYYGLHWRPPGHTNHGELIEPPRALSLNGEAVLLRGKWSLVYVGAGTCDEDCRRTLYFIRQTWLGLAQLMPRAQQVFLITRDCCDDAFLESEHPQLITVNLGRPGDADAAAVLAQFPPERRPGGVFIVDPKGNLMMRYDAHADPHGLHLDLEKLLKLSHIG
jgi:hypothetical protein